MQLPFPRLRRFFHGRRKGRTDLFLAIHGNAQNGDIARADWEPIVGTSGLWQLETVQSAEPDGYGTYRWSYDSTSYLPVANSLERVKNQGYQNIACGGFSAGCDMLLRAVTFSSARCDLLILQSPWIPILQDTGGRCGSCHFPKEHGASDFLRRRGCGLSSDGKASICCGKASGLQCDTDGSEEHPASVSCAAREETT